MSLVITYFPDPRSPIPVTPYPQRGPHLPQSPIPDSRSPIPNPSPRHFLVRMIEAAKTQGLEVQAAFENEFYLLQQSGDRIIPADSTVFASTQAMDIHREVKDIR